MMTEYYKPSNKFSVPGLIMLALSIAAIGAVVSIIYLKIQQICPSAYLCILITCGFGLLLGLISKVLCKAFKIRSIPVAMVALGIGLLVFTYLKWALWCSEYYTDLATTLAAGIGSSSFNETMNMIAVDGVGLLEAEFGDEAGIFYSLSNLFQNDVNLSSTSYFAALPYYIAHPLTMLTDISHINTVGTWGLGRSADTAVSGIFLYIVWLGEFLILTIIPVMMTLEQVRFPFIESENDWAQEYKERDFVFEYFSVGAKKHMIENDANTLLKETPVVGALSADKNYVKLTLYHSSDFSECYITLYELRYNQKSKNYVTDKQMEFARVDSNFFNELSSLFTQKSIANYVSAAPKTESKEELLERARKNYTAEKEKSEAEIHTGLSDM